MIRIIHNTVKGRIRFHIGGLFRNDDYKSFLRDSLSGLNEARKVSPNVLTGNLLILFDPSCNPRIIQAAVKQAASAYHFDHTVSPGPLKSVKRPTVIEKTAHQKTSPKQSAPSCPDAQIQASSCAWWKTDLREVMAFFGATSDAGLNEALVVGNQARFGANTMPKSAARSGLSIFIDQFTSLPVMLLGFGAGLSALTGGMLDAVVITGVIVLNGIIGYITESQTEKTISSLKKLVRPSAEVLREGRVSSIGADEVVCGDILILKPGYFVAADARLIETEHLSVDESILTGESLPSNKSVEILDSGNVLVGDRHNMIFAGSRVSGGQGKAVVVAVGVFTEIGRITSLVNEAESPETPVEKQLIVVSNQLTAISGLVCFAVFTIGLLRGSGFIEMLKLGVSLAVAALPEGLPAVATTTLALGVKNMRRHGVLVRNLDAVCAIGSVQTICFDKTGTVTLNQMTVTKLYVRQTLLEAEDGILSDNGSKYNPYDHEEMIRLFHVGVLCSETQLETHNGTFTLNGSPTENALVALAISAGVDVQAVRSMHPMILKSYRAENQLYMRTLHKTSSGDYLCAIKGSPLEVLGQCYKYIKDGVLLDLNEDVRDEIEWANERMAGQALRVLGLAYYLTQDSSNGNCNGQWIWLGLVGMEDPVRTGVKESVYRLQAAGLDTVMITGDQSPTAYSIGMELDLSQGKALEIVDASDLSSNNPDLLKGLCKKANVFSRVSPSDKLQIVRALQGTGKIVAVAGDGINDGPALKAADIGIAMGATGTDVAREVADIVLEHDDLETLIIALSDGRTLYNNIRKALHYLLATNFSEMAFVATTSSLGLGHPLSAIQLLWINLISDVFPGLALAMEPPEPDVLSRKPRNPDEAIVTDDDYRQIAFEAGLIGMSTLVSYGYGVAKYGIGPAANVFAFQTITIAQILHAWSCRSKTHSVFQESDRPKNEYLNIAVIGSLAIQTLTQLVPSLRGLFGLTQISMGDIAVIGASSSLPFLINETRKLSFKRIPS